MDTESAERRLHPRMTDTDWLVLRGMRPAIDRLTAQVGRAGATAIDLGCGSQPYRPIFDARGITYRGADLEVRMSASTRTDTWSPRWER